jgi:glycosyl transferase family 25
MTWPFSHACAINLDSRPDRWQRLSTQLDALGVSAERFSAVSIQQLQSDQPSAALRAFLLRVDGDSSTFEHKLCATWACMRSHLAVIAHAKALGWPEVLILEDDCEFESYAPTVLTRVYSQLPRTDWDMLYLGGTVKKNGWGRKITSNLRSVTKVRLAHAYVVKASIYGQILEQAEHSGLPIDWYYSEVLLSQVNAFMVSPMLVRQQLMDMSDIEQVVRKPKIKTRLWLQRLIANLRYGGNFR